MSPEDNELEISLFGPGYGESILLHIGCNQWIIVDSCIDPASETPIPLSYLRKINIDPEIAVKQIIATHWHDDHIRGLAATLRECNSAEFVCSDAMGYEEFSTVLSAYSTRSMMISTGVSEFYEILKLLEERGKKTPHNRPKLAIADRLLWRSDPTSGEVGPSCLIYSLSPSDNSVIQARIEITKLIPQSGETKCRVPLLGPNHAAVVLLVQVGKCSILLGSDLEETGDPRRGWSAIISSGTRSQKKASFFKIPHHGSANADHPEIWSVLLEPEPLSVLTPFSIGNIVLPTKDDVARICTKTIRAYSTGIPRRIVTKGRDRMVEKQIREMGIKLRQVYFSVGQVRARGRFINENLKWTVELFGGALPLNKVYQ